MDMDSLIHNFTSGRCHLFMGDPYINQCLSFSTSCGA